MSNTFSIGAHRVPGGSSRLMFNKGGANSVVHGTARENSTNADHIFMLGLYPIQQPKNTASRNAEVQRFASRFPKTSVFWGSNGWPDVRHIIIQLFSVAVASQDWLQHGMC